MGFFCLYLVTLGGLRLIRRHLASGMENFTLWGRYGNRQSHGGRRSEEAAPNASPLRPGTQRRGNASPAGTAVLPRGSSVVMVTGMETAPCAPPVLQDRDCHPPSLSFWHTGAPLLGFGHPALANKQGRALAAMKSPEKRSTPELHGFMNPTPTSSTALLSAHPPGWLLSLPLQGWSWCPPPCS